MFNYRLNYWLVGPFRMGKQFFKFFLMKLEKKHYQIIAAISILILVILYVRGAKKGKEEVYDYVPLPYDGVG